MTLDDVLSFEVIMRSCFWHGFCEHEKGGRGLLRAAEEYALALQIYKKIQAQKLAMDMITQRFCKLDLAENFRRAVLSKNTEEADNE